MSETLLRHRCRTKPGTMTTLTTLTTHPPSLECTGSNHARNNLIHPSIHRQHAETPRLCVVSKTRYFHYQRTAPGFESPSSSPQPTTPQLGPDNCMGTCACPISSRMTRRERETDRDRQRQVEQSRDSHVRLFMRWDLRSSQLSMENFPFTHIYETQRLRTSSINKTNFLKNPQF